jgi:YebC/PmpR family DNA-binding regulatory protein
VVRALAGHSKWHNRMHRKSRQDAKRGALFSKMAKEIMVAARQGGGEPEANPRLRLAIERARDAGVPLENIERAIKRGTGAGEGEAYEELLYEGYGPGGVAILLEILTDNRNRTAGEIRHIFSRHGGNLGESGCVLWMFDKKGLLVIDRSQSQLGEDQVLDMALEAGAEDVEVTDETYEVVTAPEDFYRVKAALERSGVRFVEARLAMIPKATTRVEGREAEQLVRLIEALEDHDDVQEVHTNVDEAELAALGAP